MAYKYLRRYTDLSSLIYILSKKKLTLLDSSKWDDKNDAKYIKFYREKRDFQSVYALCFTTVEETSHHWRVFAPGNHGICLVMKKDIFLDSINKIKEIRHDYIKYKKANEVEKNGIDASRLPFLKRYAFRDEKEFRIIYQNKNKISGLSFDIDFDISCLKQIILSNSMPLSQIKPVTSLLKSINGCSDIKITRTSLNKNTRWSNAGKLAT